MNTITQQSTIHSTFVTERSYPVPPERVFAALADPVQKRRWFAEGASHDVEKFEMDFRVEGVERAQYRLKPGTPFPGTPLENLTTFQDIVLNRRVVLASTMSFNGKRISVSLATFDLVPTTSGTDLIFTHQGAFFEGADGPEMREAGWRKLFGQLAEELAR